MKTTLQKAHEERLLLNGDIVNVAKLYSPPKTLLREICFGIFEPIGLQDCFEDIYISIAKNTIGKIRFIESENKAEVKLECDYWKTLKSSDEERKFIADKLLSNPDYNIEASEVSEIWRPNYFVLTIRTDEILVEFDDNENAYLVLPSCTVYSI